MVGCNLQEMKNVRPAFEVFEGGVQQLPSGFQEIKCHMIFDVKIGENFCRKARLVAGGHTTDAPATLTYSSVISCDSTHHRGIERTRGHGLQHSKRIPNRRLP